MSCARGRDAGVRQKLAAQVVRRKSPNEICCYRCRCARALRDGDACRAVAGRQAIRAIAGRARGDEQRHVCVELPPLRCAVGYAIALHDITHIVLSYSRDDDWVAGRALSKFAGMPNRRFLLTLAEHFEREGPKVIAKVAKE